MAPRIALGLLTLTACAVQRIPPGPAPDSHLAHMSPADLAAPPSTAAVMAWNSRPIPTCEVTPANPASRMPAITAEVAEITKAAVRTRGTFTPESAAARSLSPTARTRRPNPPRAATTARAAQAIRMIAE